MLPKTLRIKGHVYTLEETADRHLPDRMGDCDNGTNHIRICKGSADSRKVELVLHEAIHAMLAGYDTTGEENVAVTLGECFTAFIKDNPGFIRHALKVLGQS